MALIAHYPLNGDTLDYSGNGNHATNHGAIANNNGKIGKCYNFTSGTNGINIRDCNFEGLTTYTMSAWVRPKGNHRNYNGAIISSGNWNRQAWSFGLSQDNTRIDVASNRYNVYVNYNTPLNKWTHITSVMKNGVAKVYINGKYLTQRVATAELESDATNTFIGRETYASGYFSFNGDLNDVRIYDHALSTKEIRDLAKAKILHYTFDDFQESTENLIESNSQITTSSLNDAAWNSPHSVEYTTRGGTSGLYLNRNVKVNPNTEYTLSYKIKKLDGEIKNIRGHINSGITCLSTKINGVERGNIRSALPVEDSSEPYKVEIVYNTGNNTDMYYNWVQVNFSQSTAAKIRVYDIQLEKKSHATPFTPTSREGIVKDISGHKNHAILDLATTPKWTSDSKIGGGAYEFDGHQYIDTGIPVTSPMFSREDSSFTISSRVKLLEKPSGSATLLGGAYYSGFAIVVNPSGGIHGYYRNSTGSYNTSAYPMELDEWCHAAVTLNSDESTLSLFINGELFASRGVAFSEFLYETMIFQINRYQYTGGNHFSNCKCHLDDVRIYATALSDDDIKELYQTRASLDDKGNLSVSNLLEFHNWNDDIKNYNLVENGDQEYESNYNFPGFTYNTEGGYLSRTSGSSTLMTSDFIPIIGNGVDSWDRYRLEGSIKGLNNTSRYYYMIICYDKFYRRIRYQDVYSRAGTATSLTQDLKVGDEWVYLDNITNWYDNGNATYTHLKGLALWHPDDDPLYKPYVYTKRWLEVAEVDKNKHRLRLRRPYSGASIPLGSPAQNHNAGGSYSYIAASNRWTDLEEWEFRSANTTITPSVSNMRYGTSYVKVGFLMNRNHTGSTLPTTKVKNLRFYNVSRPQKLESNLSGVRLEDKGIANFNTIREVGLPIRYIRDYVNGSTSNSAHHWVEVQAYDSNDINVALDKTATSPLLTNGNTATRPYYHTGIAGTGGNYAEVDLGEVTIIDYLKIWHYYGDGRSYHNTRTEVSADGENWITVFDSTIEGEYKETSDGHTIILRPDKMSIDDKGNLFVSEVKEVF